VREAEAVPAGLARHRGAQRVAGVAGLALRAVAVVRKFGIAPEPLELHPRLVGDGRLDIGLGDDLVAAGVALGVEAARVRLPIVDFADKVALEAVRAEVVPTVCELDGTVDIVIAETYLAKEELLHILLRLGAALASEEKCAALTRELGR
jgi:hypothetical protein